MASDSAELDEFGRHPMFNNHVMPMFEESILPPLKTEAELNGIPNETTAERGKIGALFNLPQAIWKRIIG